MGLTIHWNLKADVRTESEAHALVERLRQQALDLRFASVGETVDLSGRDADYKVLPNESPARWLLIQAGQYVEKDDCHYAVAPQHVIALLAHQLIGVAQFAGQVAEPQRGFHPYHQLGWAHWLGEKIVATSGQRLFKRVDIS